MHSPPPQSTLFPYTTLFRSGLIGISKGGTETYLTAAVDPRVTVAVPVIGVQSFRWGLDQDRKSTRLNSSHSQISYAVFCLKKKRTTSVSPISKCTSARGTML